MAKKARVCLCRVRVLDLDPLGDAAGVVDAGGALQLPGAEVLRAVTGSRFAPGPADVFAPEAEGLLGLWTEASSGER